MDGGWGCLSVMCISLSLSLERERERVQGAGGGVVSCLPPKLCGKRCVELLLP